MEFSSILFPVITRPVLPAQSAFFHDLNLNQIFAAALQGKEEYNLAEIFCTPLLLPEEVRYRQAVMQDLENDLLRSSIDSFAAAMHQSRQQEKEAAQCYDPYSMAAGHFVALTNYAAAIRTLQSDLVRLAPESNGLQNFMVYLQNYIGSDNFVSICDEAAAIFQTFETTIYTLYIFGNEITIDAYHQELDLNQIVADFFARFAQGTASVYKDSHFKDNRLNHIEVMIMEQLSRRFPHHFSRLQQFCARYQTFRDAVLVRFDREIQFYLAYLQCMVLGRKRGLHFCYPVISETNREISGEDGCDLALQLSLPEQKVVGNTFSWQGRERMMIVTGPNQGGKTTFARMVGQLMYLASLGLPVAARQAEFFLPDHIFTHFERQEAEVTQNGKLQDDIIRIHEILPQLTQKSFLIINEMFASTTLSDAVALGRLIMQAISARDTFCIYVTFLEELATFNEKTISMVSEIAADQETRTYRLGRRVPDGCAYALSMAAKYHLTTSDILRRLRHESTSSV